MSNIRIPFALTLIAALVFLAAGCASDPKVDLQQTGADPGAAAVGMTDVQQQTRSGRAGGKFVGHVAETMNSGGYTYVQLEGGGETIWAAGPTTTVAVGDEVGVSLEMAMPDFHSDTLDRTFAELYFVGGFDRVAGTGGTSSASTGTGGDPHSGLDMNSGMPSGMTSADVGGSSRSLAPAATGDLSGIEKPDGGHTVAELWDGSDTLAGQIVVFRGKVVKYNSGILGRNWLHLQDGSGEPAMKNNDITVTTDQNAKVGDVVTVRGTLSVQKDFGAGYSYPVIIEDASLDISL